MTEPLGEMHHNKAIDWPITLTLMIGLVILVVITFGRVNDLAFVNYDDPDYVTQNLIVQDGLSWDGVRWAFTSLQATNWHPVTWLSHMLDSSLFGVNPRGHHWMNVALHGINAALLFLLLTSMTKSMWPSAVAAALFAIHPLRVESVAWVAERKDMLSTLFGLLAILAYVRWTRSRSVAQYGLLIACFGCSLMSKPMLVTLPFLLMLLDVWPLRRLGSDGRPASSAMMLFVEKLPLLAMSAASSAITVLAQARGGAMSDLEAISLPLRLANAAVASITYLWQMIWPTPLAVLYPFRQDIPWAVVLVCVGLLAVITVAAVIMRRRWPYVLVGWLWYLGTLVPVIGLVQVGQQAHADRYTYVPLIGIVIAMVWTGASLLRSERASGIRIAVAAAIATVVLALCLRTHDQLRYWRDSVTLFEHSISVAGGTAVSCNNLGGALIDQGRLDEAIVWLERALQLNPEHAPAHSNLGMAYANNGNADLAEQSFLNALRIDPKNAKANFNLGVLRLNQNRLKEAETLFRAALDAKPDYYEARVNLGNVLVMIERTDEGQAMLTEIAAEHPNELLAKASLAQSMLDQNQLVEAAQLFGEVLSMDSNNVHALGGLGTAMLRLGQPVQAIQHLRAALAIEPNDAGVQNSLGLALAQTGQFAQAETAFREAARLQPDSVDAWNNLGKALHALNRPEDAIKAFHTAIELKPELASAHYHLGNVLLSISQLEEASASYERALQLEPDSIDPRYNLGFTQLRRRQWADAEAAFRETLHRSANHRGSQRGLIEAILSQSDAPPGKLMEALQLAETLNGPSEQHEPATLLMLAAALSCQGRFAEAVSSLNLAKGMAPPSSPVLAEIDRCAALYNMGQRYVPPPASP